MDNFIGFIKQANDFQYPGFVILVVYATTHSPLMLTEMEKVMCIDVKDAEFEFYDRWPDGYIHPSYLDFPYPA